MEKGNDCPVEKQSQLKALTVRQPWASLIMRGLKKVENRSWKPSIQVGERFVIHAGYGNAKWPDRIPESLRPEVPKNIAHGAALGTVRLASVHEAGVECGKECDVFGSPDYRYHWVLDDPQPFASPIPMKGSLRLWDFTEE